MPVGWRKLGVLLGLYFVQGLPFGFQAVALPVYLRERGVSLTAIGLAGALSLPWMLKALWAPLVDRYASYRFGRRKSWIVPMQLGLSATCFVAAPVSEHGVAPLLLLVFVMNLFAATQDIAVDGLAVDLLSDSELGLGNAGQVVGYKLGMITGGGLLVWASAAIGWYGLFVAMGTLVAFVLLAVLFYTESPKSAEPGLEPQALGAILRRLREALRSKRALWLLGLVATYKLGETLIDRMFTPFVYDQGFEASQIGLWIGTYGLIASLAGSAVGGVVAWRLPLPRALLLAAAVRVIPLAAQFWLTLIAPAAADIIAVTCAEHFFGGALTTVTFAFMMSQVDKRIGASHYTLLATVEVLGKSSVGWFSGLFADTIGYSALFAAGVVLSVAYLGILVPLWRPGAMGQNGSLQGLGAK